MASRLSKIASVMSNARKSWDDVFLKNMPMGEGDSTILDNPYSKVDLVFTCISTTARAIAQVPLVVVKYNSSGASVPVKPDHPWQQLINRPNYLMNRSLFIESVLSYWLLDGNVCIIPYPYGSNAPASLWPVRWNNIKYTTDNNGHLAEWLYTAGLPGSTVGSTNNPLKLPPDEVVHLKFFNPDNLIDGLAPSKAGRLPILGAYKSAQYNQNFFDNGAVPGGVLQTEQRLQKDTVELVRSEFNQRHQGRGKAHKIAILSQGLTYQPMGITQKDMDFIELRKADRESIMQIYGMKKSIISVTETVNHSTAIAERKEWWKGTCMPLMRMIMDCFNTFLFNKGSEKLIFDISNIEALHEDFNDKVKTSDTLLRLGFTRNEVNARLELGFPEVEWGNYAYMPVNMMPVNIEGMGLFAPKPEPNEPGNPDEPGDDTPPGGTPNDNPDGKNDEKLSSTPLGKTMSNRISRAIFDYRSATMRLLESGENHTVHALPVDMFSERLLRLLDPITLVLIDETNEEDKLSHIAARYLLDLQKRLDDFFLALKSQVCNALDEGKTNKEIKAIFNKATKVADAVAEKEMQAAIDFRRVKNG